MVFGFAWRLLKIVPDLKADDLKEWFKVSLGVNVYCFVFTRDFAWSPSDDMIAFWVPENKDTPARVTLMEIPSRKEIRVKNLFNVSEVKFSYFIFIIIFY